MPTWLVIWSPLILSLGISLLIIHLIQRPRQ